MEKESINVKDVKIVTEKEVKQKPTIEELTKVESPGKPSPANLLEEKPKRKYTAKNPSAKSRISKISKKAEPEEIMPAKKDSILIITEKPQAALKIASALGKPRKYSENNVPYYELEKNNEKIIVASAVGHLFNLTYSAGQKGWPIFNLEWQPSYEKKGSEFTKRYFDVLKKLVRKAKEIIIATDFDTEGEVIGWNVLRFIGKQKTAKRMKFSTLTADELRESYEHPLPELNWQNAYAGESRHYIDWMYGINLSRALMSAIKTTGSFKILSIGRVQGPALKIIVDREREIEKFKPEPYWQVFARVDKTLYKHPKDIFDKKELEKFKDIKEADAETKTSDEKLLPPVPFDLTSLQTEAYKHYKISPSETLRIAQKLYIDGVISYPRTSSQKIPDAIQPKKILSLLAQRFPSEIKNATRKAPIEGKKSDPAHPCVFPTGEFKELEAREEKLYNLIARRFISAFSPDAKLANKKTTLTAGKEKIKFTASAVKILEKGWISVYPAKIEESDIPDLNGKVNIDEIKFDEKETQPPKRYTPASLVSTLEKKSIGTKCLTEDMKIIANDKEEFIKDVFKAGNNLKTEKDIETKEIIAKTISLNKKDLAVIRKSNLISRRKKEKFEEIIKIKTPNSAVTATKDHIVYVYNNGLIEEKQIQNLKVNDKIIALTKHYKEGDVLLNLSDMNNKHKIKNEEIMHKFGHSKNGIKLANFPIRWSTPLAWVLGYYYGDGSYSNPKYNGSHQVSFTTTEKKALELLKENIKEIFGNYPYCYDLINNYKVDCSGIMSAVLIKMFPNLEGKHQIDIPKEFIGDFLRGFFDADGNVHLRPEGKAKINNSYCNSFATPRIKITLASKELIEWVSALLDKIGIENHIIKNTARCRGKIFDCWTILLGGKEKVEKFAIHVGFDSYKEDILFRGLKCNSPHYEIIKNSGKVYFALSKEELSPEELVQKNTLSRYKVMRSIKHLSRLGLISKKRIGNRSRQKWVYSLKNKSLFYDRYYIKLLFEKISKNIYAIPIKSISKENYEGYVYDISVSEDSPNFLVAGNILVHNSTRSTIIDTLFERGYLDGKSIQATPLGLKIIEALEEYSPIIIDENLTRQLEEEMDNIQNAKDNLDKKEAEVIEKAKRVITDVSKEFKAKESEIGKTLAKGLETLRANEQQANTLIQCPTCKKGNLRIMYNRMSRRYFVACSAYPECRQTFSLPPNSLIKKSEKICEADNFPKLLAIRKGKRPWEFCFNPECPIEKAKREEWRAKKASATAQPSSESVSHSEQEKEKQAKNNEQEEKDDDDE